MTGHQGLSKSGGQSANAGWALPIGMVMASSPLRMAIIMAIMVLRPFELRSTSRPDAWGAVEIGAVEQFVEPFVQGLRALEHVFQGIVGIGVFCLGHSVIVKATLRSGVPGHLSNGRSRCRARSASSLAARVSPLSGVHRSLAPLG